MSDLIINPYRHAGGGGATNGLLTGLVSYYKLDETTGTTAYDAHGSNDGTVVGATINQTGKIDKCYDLDGNNDYVDCGNITEMQGTDTITVSAWAKKEDTTQPGAGETIISKWETGFNSWILFQRESVRKTRFLIYIGDTGYAADADSAGYDTNWHHYVGRYDGSEVSLWIDGVKQSATASITGNIDADNAIVKIGTYQAVNDWFEGYIDEVALWDTDLSDSQIAALYNSGSGLAYSNFTS